MKLPVGGTYELELNAPALYTQKSPTETPKGVITAKAETVDWKVSFEGAYWILGIGGATVLGAGLGAGLSSGGGGDKKVQSRSQ